MTNKSHAISALDEFLSLRVLIISLLSLIISMGIIVFILFLTYDNAGSLSEVVASTWQEIKALSDSVFEKLKDYPALSFLLEHKLVMILFHILVYAGFGIVFYYAFFIVYAFVVSFFNGILISHLQKKYYPTVELKGINLLLVVFFYLKTFLITTILFILLSPTYLIPGLNFFIFLPLYYLFHKTIVFDVSSVINTRKEYRKIKKVNWAELKGHTVFCFLLTLIPLFGILMYPYYVLYVGSYMLKETKELREHQQFNAR